MSSFYKAACSLKIPMGWQLFIMILRESMRALIAFLLIFTQTALAGDNWRERLGSFADMLNEEPSALEQANESALYLRLREQVIRVINAHVVESPYLESVQWHFDLDELVALHLEYVSSLRPGTSANAADLIIHRTLYCLMMSLNMAVLGNNKDLSLEAIDVTGKFLAHIISNGELITAEEGASVRKFSPLTQKDAANFLIDLIILAKKSQGIQLDLTGLWGLSTWKGSAQSIPEYSSFIGNAQFLATPPNLLEEYTAVREINHTKSLLRRVALVLSDRALTLGALGQLNADSIMAMMREYTLYGTSDVLYGPLQRVYEEFKLRYYQVLYVHRTSPAGLSPQEAHSPPQRIVEGEYRARILYGTQDLLHSAFTTTELRPRAR